MNPLEKKFSLVGETSLSHFAIPNEVMMPPIPQPVSVGSAICDLQPPNKLNKRLATFDLRYQYCLLITIQQA